MTPEKRFAKAIRDAQLVLSAYLEPGFREPERAIDELLIVFNDEGLLSALDSVERTKEFEGVG